MKRVAITQLGAAEVLQPIDCSLPEPGDGTIRIRVEAAGVAWADIQARQGKFPHHGFQGKTPGFDVAGVVDALGPNVHGFTVGDRVAAVLPSMGAYAEFAIASASYVVHVPKNLKPETAVALVLNGATAQAALVKYGHLSRGQTVLVTNGAGGVGHLAIQLARSMECRVIASASTAKQERLRELGALPIDYRQQSIRSRVLELTGGGADVAVDLTGTAVSSFRSLSPRGRLAVVGDISLADSKNPIRTLSGLFGGHVLALCSRRSSTFVNMIKLLRSDPGWFQNTMADLFALAIAGKLTPVIGGCFPLADAAEAHRRLQSGRNEGKLVLIP